MYAQFQGPVKGFNTYHFRLLKVGEHWYVLETRIEPSEGGLACDIRHNLLGIICEVQALHSWLQKEIEEAEG